MEKPYLFGISNSNRNFESKKSWGKNVFNSSFPVSLVNYMDSKGLNPIYLILDKNLKVTLSEISAKEIFGIKETSTKPYFSFESAYKPYTNFTNKLPRNDLVVQEISDGEIDLRSLEIKLTVIPDESTFDKPQHQFGCELVVRPDTILYAALSISENFSHKRELLLSFLEPICSKINDWTNESLLLPLIPSFIDIIDQLLTSNLSLQKPLILQPIWKTKGKSAELDDQALDVFVWSDYSFTRLFIDQSKDTLKQGHINRFTRTTLWFIKLLFDFANNGIVEQKEIFDSMSFNVKNDKAFSINGIKTNQYMNCPELLNPRISKQEIKNIILNGGHEYLSPERRLDAAIANNPDIFN